MTISEKRQDLPPGLWVVATPIGNLSDVTERAKRALASADAVLCEDTRMAARLYSALGIARPAGGFERLDAHASEAAIERAVDRMREGASLALVTDAGTPAISDPGARLVRRARESRVRVTPCPGPSAVATFLSIAGLEETAFSFLGFFPRAKNDRRVEILKLWNSAAPRACIWFESPQRIAGSLAAVAELARSDAGSVQEVVAAKELTKLHERVFFGSAEEVSEQVAAEVKREGTLGEWCFCVRFGDAPEGSAPLARGESSEWVKVLEALLKNGASASDAARKLSQQFGIARNLAYRAALERSGKKSGRGD